MKPEYQKQLMNISEVHFIWKENECFMLNQGSAVNHYSDLMLINSAYNHLQLCTHAWEKLFYYMGKIKKKINSTE